MLKPSTTTAIAVIHCCGALFIMEYRQFLEASNKLKKFIKEQEKLNDVIKVISPSSTGVVEFGNEFIDDYIQVVEIALGDVCNWFSWFVFENDFGAKKLKVTVEGKEYLILGEQQFFNICIKLHSVSF